jgi:PiT family inorganic phosphate transporter
MPLIVTAVWTVHKKHSALINMWARKLQLPSACLFSLSHGGNDAQKTKGTIPSLVLSAAYQETRQVPLLRR